MKSPPGQNETYAEVDVRKIVPQQAVTTRNIGGFFLVSVML